ncbi:MAG TPA: hypothetical protein VMZ27_05580 [Candidatus Saccharimonadales bacterium]|nr:hypothetical protein [Candidatus Saccharimonadales bacterium]
MKSRATKWAFSSSSSRAIAPDFRSGLARIRFPSGSIISERVMGEIEAVFPRDAVSRIEETQKPAETENKRGK